METPAKVKQAAQYLIDMYGDRVEYLGKYQGAEAFYYHFPDDVTAGPCPVYLETDGEVREVPGFEAMKILDSFVENFNESGIE